MLNTAVILAAGMSARLNNAVAEKPKGFLEIGGKSLIERSIDLLQKHGVATIVIGTGYLSEYYDRLAKTCSSITTYKSERFNTTSSFYTLYNMKHLIQEDFLLLESDLIYEERAISHLLTHLSDDVILASGRTLSQDEVFIETDSAHILQGMSKNENDLGSVFGELVGISKISIAAFQRVCGLFETEIALLESIEYEYAFTKLSRVHPIKVTKLDDLVWAEIDTQKHLERVKTLIYPKLTLLNQRAL